MLSKTRFGVLLTLALALALAFGAVALPSSLTVAQAQGKTLRVAFSQEPDSLNPNYTSMAFAQWAIFLCQANLWDYDDKLAPVPVLVQEIPTAANGGISSDGKTITLKLKKDLKWSDGQPLNADDLVFNYEMYQDKGNNYQQGTIIQQELTKIEKVDDVTVKLTFKDPQPYPENVAGVNGYYLLPAHILKPVYEKDKSLEKADFNQNPTAFSGPYVLKEWKRGESLTFTANPNYAGAKPKIDTVVIKIFPEPETSYAALAKGDIDFIPNLQPADAKKIQDLTKDVTIASIYGSYRESLWINVRTDKFPRAGHPALKDVKVRQALRLAINRRGLVKDLLFDNTTVAESLYADSPFENKSLKFVEYDPEAAKKLLDEAGWKVGSDGVREKDGVKLELIYSTTTAAQRKKNQAVIQQQLADVGVKVKLETVDPTQYFGQYQQGGTIANGNCDLCEYANNTVTTNPANARTFMCDEISSADNPGGQNYIGFCNTDMDKLQLVTEQSLDPKAGLDAAYKIQEIQAEQVPVIILYNRNDIYAYVTSHFAAPLRIGAGITNQWFDIVNWDLK